MARRQTGKALATQPKSNKDKLLELEIGGGPVPAAYLSTKQFNGRCVSKNERDLLKQLQNLQKYCQKVEQKYERTATELRTLKQQAGHVQKEQFNAQASINHLKEQQEEFAKREQKYTDYIGKLEAKLVQQAKLMHGWARTQQEGNEKSPRNQGNEEAKVNKSQLVNLAAATSQYTKGGNRAKGVASRTLSPPLTAVTRPKSAHHLEQAARPGELLQSQSQDIWEQALQLQRQHITGLNALKLANLKDALA